MRLIFTASIIALKRSMLIVLSAALCLSLLAAVAVPTAQPPQVKLAIINQDKDPFATSVIKMLINKQFSGVLSAEFFENEKDTQNCAAVLILPNGFFKSVMTGENISPKVYINVSSPLEGLWIGALAKSASRLLSSAQNVVSAIYAAIKEDNVPPEQAEEMIVLLNGILLNDYLSRKGRFESVLLSATGAVSAVEYYISAAAAFLLFTISFLLFDPISQLKVFGAISKKPIHCFCAAFLSCLLTAFALTALSVIAVSQNPKLLLTSSFFVCSLLLCGVMLIFPCLSQNGGFCAALSCGFCLIQAIFGGLLLPEALLPQPLANLCGFLPLSIMRRAFAHTAYNCGFESMAAALLWCALLLSLSFILWFKKEELR